MSERLFSLETEYASVVRGSDGKGLNRNPFVVSALALAERKFPCLKGQGSAGLFLANGSRLYVDCSSFLEVALPECSSPWEVVRYTQAGERMLEQLAADFVARGEAAEMAFYKTHVDYTGMGTTWGCHENYLHRVADLPRLYAQLLPHLASRIIYTGPGGFDPGSRGIQFTLSPRSSSYVVSEVTESSTNSRGMIHTRQESLCGPATGYRRLHLICGDSLCSETAAWLKVGTTALVVALIDAGLSPAAGLDLPFALAALRTFARDDTCTARTHGGRPGGWTAIAIQRHYLGQAEAHAHDGFMPSWAPEVCQRWRDILDLLEAGAPDSVADVLDWAIKRVVYADLAARRGLDWASLPHYDIAIHRIMTCLAETSLSSQPVTVEFLLGDQSPIREEMSSLTAFIEGKGLSWDGFRAYLALREELFEADWRFGEVGPRSLFRALDQAGVLRHRVPGVENIEHAMANPPPLGRARLRGNAIRRFAGQDGRYVAEWHSVTDRWEGRVLDLSDPFAAVEQWSSPRQAPENRSAPSSQSVLAMLEALARGDFPDVTPDGYRVGEHVVLGRHDPVNGVDNWCSDMQAFVGRTATIVATSGRDIAGCCTVNVDVDGARWRWRTRNLRRAEESESVRA